MITLKSTALFLVYYVTLSFAAGFFNLDTGTMFGTFALVLACRLEFAKRDIVT